jgi:hypothetical protein
VLQAVVVEFVEARQPQEAHPLHLSPTPSKEEFLKEAAQRSFAGEGGRANKDHPVRFKLLLELIACGYPVDLQCKALSV